MINIFKKMTSIEWHLFVFKQMTSIEWHLFSSKDPVDESGETNLYRMIGNNTLNQYDVNGLACCGSHVLKSGEYCCNNQTPYNPKTQCCRNGDVWTADYLSCVEKCIKKSLSLGALNAGAPFPKKIAPPFRVVNKKSPMTTLLSSIAHFVPNPNITRALRDTGRAASKVIAPLTIAEGTVNVGCWAKCGVDSCTH